MSIAQELVSRNDTRSNDNDQGSEHERRGAFTKTERTTVLGGAGNDRFAGGRGRDHDVLFANLDPTLGTAALSLVSLTSFGITANSRLDFNSVTLFQATVTSPARSLLNLISVPVELRSCPVNLSPFFSVSSSLISGSFLVSGVTGFLAEPCASAERVPKSAKTALEKALEIDPNLKSAQERKKLL